MLEPEVHGAGRSRHDSDDDGLALANLSILLLTAAPVLALRAPVFAALTGLSPLLLSLVSVGDIPFVLYVSLVSVAMVAMWSRPRTAVALGVVSMLPVLSYLVGLSALLIPYGGGSVSTQYSYGVGDVVAQGVAYALATTIALLLAWWMRSSALRSRRAAGLAARADEVEHTSAVVGERARLARDLHDVVAHHVSLIAVRAETAPYTVDDLSPGARVVFAEIADDSRRALDELRGVLGILRRSSSSSDEAERAPQPGAAEIGTLVEQARAAGAKSDGPSPAGAACRRRSGTSPTGSCRRRSPTLAGTPLERP